MTQRNYSKGINQQTGENRNYSSDFHGFSYIAVVQIHIRIAGAEDAELIANLSRQTFYETFASRNTPANMEKFMNEQFTKEALMKEVLWQGNLFIIASVDNEPAGYVCIKQGRARPELENKPCWEVARIYVISKWIGKGVGNSLMRQIVDLAIERKIELLWLGVWKENETAIDFYERWGFEIFGEQDFLLGTDLQKDWLMKKDLTVSPLPRA